MGKPSVKREALTVDNQRKFLETIFGYNYENQYRFILQTGLRSGELIGLRWSDIDFDDRTIKIQRTMNFRYENKKWMTGPPKSKSGFRTTKRWKNYFILLHIFQWIVAQIVAHPKL